MSNNEPTIQGLNMSEQMTDNMKLLQEEAPDYLTISTKWMLPKIKPWPPARKSGFTGEIIDFLHRVNKGLDNENNNK